MKNDKRGILTVGAMLVVALALGVGISLVQEDALASNNMVVRGFIYPAGTPSPAGYQPGLVVFQDLDIPVNTPAPGQIGSHWQVYWSQVQPSLTGAPNWNAPATRVAAVATAGMQTWLSLTFYEDSFQPFAVATDAIYAPYQVPTVLYYESPSECKELAPDYGDANFRQGYYDAVTSMLAEFGDDPNVGGFILELGSTGETQNVVGGDYSGSSCPNGQYEFELKVPCSEFTEWVEQAMQVWRAGTNKPLYVSVHEKICNSFNEWKSAATVMAMSYRSTPTPGATPNPIWSPTPTPLYVGYRSKALQADIWDAYQGNDWGKLQAALKFADGGGGAAFTPGYGATSYDSTLRTGFADAMVYGALSHGASHLIFQSSWLPYVSAGALYAITTTIGTTAIDSPSAWVVLRAPEFKQIPVGEPVNTYQGVPGPFEHLAAIVNATATPACVSAVATSAAGSDGAEPPYVCKLVIAGTPAPEARNVLYYPASKTIGVDIDDDWAASFGTSLDAPTVKVNRLNTGTASWSLVYKTLTGVVTSTITNTNSATWVTQQFDLANVVLDGSFTADADMQLVTGAGGGQYFHSVMLESNQEREPANTPTPTPTPTETLTPTPTSTLTPTPTPTSTPSYPAGVRFNEVSPSDYYDWNLSGNVSPADRWYELVNWQSSAQQMGGWQIGNGASLYTFPYFEPIPAYGRRAFLAEDTVLVPVTGTLTLYNALSIEQDSVTYGTQADGLCYAAIPDASTTWDDDQICTPGRQN